MRELRLTAFYEDGSTKLLVGEFVKFLGYKDPVLGRPSKYETHVVLSPFELSFLLSSARGWRNPIKFNDRITITKEPYGIS